MIEEKNYFSIVPLIEKKPFTSIVPLTEDFCGTSPAMIPGEASEAKFAMWGLKLQHSIIIICKLYIIFHCWKYTLCQWPNMLPHSKLSFEPAAPAHNLIITIPLKILFGSVNP